MFEHGEGLVGVFLTFRSLLQHLLLVGFNSSILFLVGLVDEIFVFFLQCAIEVLICSFSVGVQGLCRRRFVLLTFS